MNKQNSKKETSKTIAAALIYVVFSLLAGTALTNIFH